MDFSPAESFMSADDQDFGSLFSSETCSPAALTSSQDDIKSEPQSPSSDDKKPVKKRKSWGQELPVPTTNLPPRKRAKTEAEKEQRRIERVLRNRAAAQSSRERKRREVEALEDEKRLIKDENLRLSARLAEMETERLALHRKLMAMTAEMTVFRSILGDKAPPSTEETTLDFTPDFTSQPTLDPTDLLAELEKSSETNAETRDVTQHPAVMLSFDLQCPSTSSPRPHWSRRRSRSTTRSNVASASTLRRSTRSSRTRSTPTITETSSFSITILPQQTSPSTSTPSSTLSTRTTSSALTSSTTPSPRSSLSPCSPSLARPLVDATGALQRDYYSEEPALVLVKSEPRELVFQRLDEAIAGEDPADALRRCCALIEERRGGLAKRIGVY